jgi:hypothetical protein
VVWGVTDIGRSELSFLSFRAYHVVRVDDLNAAVTPEVVRIREKMEEPFHLRKPIRSKLRRMPESVHIPGARGDHPRLNQAVSRDTEPVTLPEESLLG